jgi:hypothetical protein
MFMKKCSYCGKEYPDDATVCAIDGQPLEPIVPPPTGVLGQYATRKELTYVAPVRTGIVLAILYGFIGLIFVPFFLLMALFGDKAGAPGAFRGVFFALFFPFLYAIGGFIGGVIMAALYNLVAKWTGGFEFEVRDATRA